MRMNASTSSGLAAVALGAAALLFSVLSIPSVSRPAAPAVRAAPATVDLTLVITGLGPVGGPATRHFYNPQMIVVRRGDTVSLRVINQTFFSHAIEFEGYGVRAGVLPGGPKGQETVSFVADKGGVFAYRCYIPFDPRTASCSPDHETMVGYLVVLDPPR